MSNDLLTKQAKIASYFIGKGYTPEQASGIAGNLTVESSLNPTALGDSGSAYGLAQWRGDRRGLLENKYGSSPTLEEQLEFIDFELNTTEKGAKRKLMSSSSAEEAALAFSRHYERPNSNPNINHNSDRVMHANKVYDSLLDRDADYYLQKGDFATTFPVDNKATFIPEQQLSNEEYLAIQNNLKGETRVPKYEKTISLTPSTTAQVKEPVKIDENSSLSGIKYIDAKDEISNILKTFTSE